MREPRRFGTPLRESGRPGRTGAPAAAPRTAGGTALTAALAVLLLAGCQLMPIPVTVDLVPHLGEHAAGSATIEVPAGTVAEGPVVRYPAGSGACSDVSRDLPVRLERASIDYWVDVGYDGPALEGTFVARLYMAPPGVDLWAAERAFGEPMTIDASMPSTRVGGAAHLSGEQVGALNTGTVCIGIELRGAGLSAEEAGSATVSYRVDVLTLWAGVRVF